MSIQLLLDLPYRPAFGREDFLCSPCNSDAVSLIDDYQNWLGYVAAICGAMSSGKTHLAAAFSAQSGATYVSAEALPMAELIHLSRLSDLLLPNGLVIDSLSRLAPHSEETLFHLINLAGERKLPLLLLSRVPLSRLSVELADLRSRLRAVRMVEIAPPDDQLLRDLACKLFRDRQMRVPPQVLAYMLPRMQRDFSGVAALVDAIDIASMRQQRMLSIPLVVEVFRSLSTAR